MPFNYPISQNRLGDYLSRGIGGFAENFRQAREGVRQRRIEDEERQRQGAIQNYELAQRGVHITGTNPLPPDVTQGMAEERAARGVAGIEARRTATPEPSVFQQSMRSAVGNAAGAGLQLTPSASPEPDTRQPGTETFIDQLRKSFVGEAPPQQDRYQTGPGYYVDTEEAAQNQAPAQYAARENAFRTALLPALVHQMTTPNPVDVHAQERDYDIAHPLPTQPPAQYTFPTGTNAEGQPIVLRANTRTGAIEPTVVGAKTDRGQQPTEFERKAGLLAPRAVEAAKELDEFFTKGAPAASLISKVPLVGNAFTPEDSQRMNQAAEMVSTAILRLESGAAISEHEVKSYAKQFLPVVGDSPEVLQQKRASLQTAVQQIQAAASRATATNAANAARTPPAAAPKLPPLSAAQKQRAKTDPDYAAFLKSKGY